MEIESVSAAASNTGRPFVALKAASSSEIDAAFAVAADQAVQGIILNPDPFFTTVRNRLIALAASHKIPVVYSFRDGAESFSCPHCNAVAVTEMFTLLRAI